MHDQLRAARSHVHEAVDALRAAQRELDEIAKPPAAALGYVLAAQHSARSLVSGSEALRSGLDELLTYDETELRSMAERLVTGS